MRGRTQLGFHTRHPVKSETDRKLDKRQVAVNSGTEGVLFSVNTDRFARPGRILAKIAGKKPLKEKGDDLLTL